MNGTQGLLPRYFQVGPLILDLLHRDAKHEGRWLALHPREFTLLWRLGEGRGQRVGRTTLLRDVWRLTHVPETNSVEVHIHRLRAKLADHGLSGLVVTDEQGGYRIDTGSNSDEGTIGPLICGAPAKVYAGNSALDSHVRVGETELQTDEDQHDIPEQRARINPTE